MSHVSRKAKHGGGGLGVADLEPRIRKAMNETRTQQALELARQLFKHEPTPEHKHLLRTTYVARARQLRTQGNSRDAATVIENAVPLGDDAPAAWLAEVAQELASCGLIRKAIELQARLAEPDAQARILGHAVDAALSQGRKGRNLLTAELQPAFDLMVRAFEQAEAGQDDLARETLQGIGLQSPFLEWKVMLRGLLAYYQKDDAKAVENWQRLNADRLSARLIAPLRFTIDRDYRAGQSAETQRILQKQADRLQGPSLLQSLRALQARLAVPEHLPQAFQFAEGIVQALRQQAPHLASRLAACFYWSVVDIGEPEDIERFRRVFGAPPDDPRLDRLRALLFERRHSLRPAHYSWQQFEQTVAANPAAWSAGAADPQAVANRVRALVWEHLGRLAALVPDVDAMPDLPDAFRNLPRPTPLDPGAEACYRKSIELAPDRVQGYQSLLGHFMQGEKYNEAAEVAQRLLERFPDHVATLETLATLRMQQERYGEALELFQKALQGNPLDRRLRAQIGMAHTYHARELAEQKRFAEARAEYQAALADDHGADRTSVLCKWAACEFKAGAEDQAEELLHQALASADHRLAVAFSMLIETIRFKLPKLKGRFDKEFTAALAEPPQAAVAVAVAQTAAAHRVAEVKYRGQKTHEKKILDYLERARKVEFSEEQLARLCEALDDLDATTLMRSFATQGKKRFPRNPFFPFHEAESYVLLGPRECPIDKVQRLLQKVRKLAQDLPPDDKKQALLDKVEHIEETISAGPMDFMREMMGMFAGLDQDDVDDEDFEDFDDFDDLPIGPFRKKRRKSR